MVISPINLQLFVDSPLSMMGIAWILLTGSPHKASDR